jgi:hypothetical protein
MKIRFILFLLLLLLASRPAMPAHAQGNIQVASDRAVLQFPESATFQAEFTASANITAVTLEYGVDQLTCGTVIAKAFPEITPSKDIQVEWTWDMRQSGSLLPGASLWWRWVVTDASGAQFTSPQKTILWLDDVHDWKVISGGKINLHYYEGGSTFGNELHDTAVQALNRLTKEVGIGTDKPVDILIYASQSDLRDSILFEPAWVGGLAVPETNSVIIAASPDNLDYGKSTAAHELTHVLVGHLTFSCLGFVPTWLNEGLAVYGEGGPQADEQGFLDQAVSDNTLMSLRSLSGNFPESDLTYLAYGESGSVVDFLIRKYGRDKMNALLLALKNGATADDALQAVYGFDTDGLEDAWRASIGAVPRAGSSNPTPVPTATTIPTIVPYSGSGADVVVQTPRPTATYDPMATLAAYATQTAAASGAASTPGSQPSLAERLGISSDVWMVLKYAPLCCLISLAAVAVPILLTVRRKHRRQP